VYNETAVTTSFGQCLNYFFTVTYVQLSVHDIFWMHLRSL